MSKLLGIALLASLLFNFFLLTKKPLVKEVEVVVTNTIREPVRVPSSYPNKNKENKTIPEEDASVKNNDNENPPSTNDDCPTWGRRSFFTGDVSPFNHRYNDRDSVKKMCNEKESNCTFYSKSQVSYDELLRSVNSLNSRNEIERTKLKLLRDQIMNEAYETAERMASQGLLSPEDEELYIKNAEKKSEAVLEEINKITDLVLWNEVDGCFFSDRCIILE